MSGRKTKPKGQDRDLLHNPIFLCAFRELPLPTLVLDRDMNVAVASRSFLERYQKPAQDVVGRKCHQVFHHMDRPCPPSRCNFPAALTGQTGCFNMHEYVNDQGMAISEEVRLAPLFDQDGMVIGVVESIIDVTDTKLLQVNLMESNEFLNRLLDSMVGVVVAADMAGKILFVNKSVQRVMGYTPAELVGKTLWSFSDDDELKRLGRTLEENQGRVLGLNTYVNDRAGERIPVRVNSSYVYRDGKPIATVGIMTDLRERIKMEDHLVQARMQVVQSDKLASLGRMAAGLAHELNNPLTGITVFAELAMEALPPDHEIQEDLKGIVEDADRCRDIVRGLLDYSRQSEISIVEQDLNQIITDTFRFIRDDAAFIHVDVERHFAPGPLMIHGDRQLLRQVFINLITNALDAMHHRGKLMVTTGIDKDGMRYVEVRDSGPGIDKEHLDRLFDPFFTTKDVGKGTGLGLSVAYGVVERHGGEIRVKETGPKGTTFLVRLPAEASQDIETFASHYDPLATSENIS